MDALLTGAATMNKQDFIQLISSLVIYYKVQHAVLSALSIKADGNKEIDDFIQVWRRIRSRAYKAGVSPKCFSAIDCRAHAIAYSWYSDSFEDYIINKHLS
jgi:hypothetical protein